MRTAGTRSQPYWKLGCGRANPSLIWAERLALRQGTWDAGGKKRLHKEKAALDLGERREAEVKGLEEKQTGWERKEKPGSESKGAGKRGGGGLEPPKHNESCMGTTGLGDQI